MRLWGIKKRANKYIYAVSKYVEETYISLSSALNEATSIRYALPLNDVEPPKDEAKESTAEPSSANAMIEKYIKSPSGFDLNRALSKVAQPTFVDAMLLHMKRKNMVEPTVYKAAHIDRRLFSKIASNRMYRPSKDTAIAIAFAMELELDEAVVLLSRAGYALSHSIKRDIIIEYFIKNKIFDLFELNAVLYSMKEKPFR